ncbi:hypothetical protein [Sphingomonas fennica]|uniref:hypothetical protein n=1 Tax=Edaphosphingomonas fennica TaxID=114404 RepID=UPI001FE7A0E8|nr:hypothetical protein [Sphingomonas fennica]
MLISPNSLAITACALRNRPAVVAPPAGIDAAAVLAEATFHLDPATLIGTVAYDAEITGAIVDGKGGAACPAGKTSASAYPVLRQDTFGTGHPGIEMNGNNWINLQRAPGLINALSEYGTGSANAGRGYTIIYEADVGATATGNFRTAFSDDANNSGRAMRTGVGTFGLGDQGASYPRRPKAGYQLAMLGAQRLASGGAWGTQARDNVFSPAPAAGLPVHASNNYLYGRGVTAESSSSGFIGRLGRLWVIPRRITSAEWVAIQKYLRAQKGAALPWAEAPVHLMYGDSNGANGALGNFWHVVMDAVAVSDENRMWQAQSGLSAADCTTLIPADVVGLERELGVPLLVTYQLYGNATSGATAVTIISGIHSAGVTGIYVATPADYSDSLTGNTEAARNAWIAAVDGTGMVDLRSPENLDIRFGLDGTQGSTVYFSDERHLSVTNPGGQRARGEADAPYYKRFLHQVLGTADVAAPSFPTPPSITGTAQVGQVLTLNLGAALDAGLVTQVEWLRDGAAGPVATLPELWKYTPVAADVGKAITARVTRQGPAGTVAATSAPTAVVVA